MERRNKLIHMAHREHGYSASEIARELNVHRSTVGRVLKQESAPIPDSRASVMDTPNVMRIMEHALQLLKTRGRDKLSLRQLAGETGMSPTNLYNYFNDKNDLLEVIRIYGFRKLHDKLESEIGKELSAEGKLRGILDAYFEFGVDQADLYEIMFNRREVRESGQRSDTFQEVVTLVDDLYHLLRDVLQDYMKLKGEVAPENLRETALSLWSRMHGLICLYIGGNFIYMSKLTRQDFWAVRDRMISTIC